MKAQELTEKYANYTPDLDRLASALCERPIDRAARRGAEFTYLSANGGRSAAWAALEHIRAAGGEASLRRLNEWDTDAWVLSVAPWAA